MTSTAARMYAALNEVVCDNETAILRAGLPHGAYTSDGVLEVESERIFERSWVCLGHVADIGEPGDFLVEAILGHEVLLIRGDDARVRAFHNVCRHRGHFVASGAGAARRFTCPYHAWTYANDGSLLHAPHADGVADFDRSALGLRPIRLETVAGALFVNLDPKAPPFEDCYPAVREEIEQWAPVPESVEPALQSPMRHEANWKASVENFSECYHCGPVHRFLTDNVIDADSYVVSAGGLVQRHVVGGRDAEMTQRLWHIWPNTAMGLYPVPGVGMVWCIRHMYPRAVDRSTYHYRWYAAGHQSVDAIREYAIQHAATTGAEDAAIVAGAQRGMGGDPTATNVLVCNPGHGIGSEHVITYFHDLVRTATATR